MAKQRLILLYGGRSAEREVSVLSAESVMRAVNYDRFSVKTYFITKDGDFIQTQEFEAKPTADEKLMTNATVDMSRKIKDLMLWIEELNRSRQCLCASAKARTDFGTGFHTGSRLLLSFVRERLRELSVLIWNAQL